MQNKRYQTVHNDHGFTLVELLIAMAVGGMIMFAVYKIYVVHQRTYTAQQAVTEMQQNMRMAIDLLSSDIRMASYKSDITNTSFKIVTADVALFSFTTDLNENNTVDPGESIAYDQYISGTVPVLGRSILPGPHEPAAENIEYLRFQYLDSAGNAIATPVAATSQIRSVQVDVVVRAGQPDPDFLNTLTYTAADGTIFGGGPQNDRYRRQQQRFIVDCRNTN